MISPTRLWAPPLTPSVQLGSTKHVIFKPKDIPQSLGGKPAGYQPLQQCPRNHRCTNQCPDEVSRSARVENRHPIRQKNIRNLASGAPIMAVWKPALREPGELFPHPMSKIRGARSDSRRRAYKNFVGQTCIAIRIDLSRNFDRFAGTPSSSYNP